MASFPTNALNVHTSPIAARDLPRNIQAYNNFRLDATDSVTADKQPVVPAGTDLTSDIRAVDTTALSDEDGPVADGRGHALRGLQFDAQFREVLHGQLRNYRQLIRRLGISRLRRCGHRRGTDPASARRPRVRPPDSVTFGDVAEAISRTI
jgi:hypothetical protein